MHFPRLWSDTPITDYDGVTLNKSKTEQSIENKVYQTLDSRQSLDDMVSHVRDTVIVI